MHSTMWLLVLVAGGAAVASSQATQQAKSDPKAALINDEQPPEAVLKTALIEVDKQSSNSDLKTVLINDGQQSDVDLKTAMKKDGESLLADPKAAPQDDEQPLSAAKERFLFLGSYSTLTHIVVTYSTSTVPSFCLQSAATVACPAGRRKRLLSASKLLNTKAFLNPSDALDSSRAGKSDDDSVMENEEGGRKFLTIWTKTLSTTTLTTTSLNTATLISLSYYCTAGSISLPGFCG